MKQPFLFFALVIFLSPALALRATDEKDLGQALAYLRVADAKADQAAAVDLIEHRPAFVLDLRMLNASDGFIEAIHDALAKPLLPHAVHIVLINASTSPALIAALDDDALHSVITIGPRSGNAKTDIAVSISDQDDRKAYEALASGTPVEKLIADSREKRRYDEAKLVHDHANGIAPSDADLPPDAEDDTVAEPAPDDKKTGGDDKKVEPAPVIDLVLERAIQLHRSLLALKKL